MSQLLKRQVAAIRTKKRSRPAHGQGPIAPVRPSGWTTLSLPPPVPADGVEPGGGAGEGVPLMAPGTADGVGEGEEEPEGGVGFGLDGGRGVGVEVVALIV
jgi:hypothetical protein